MPYIEVTANTPIPEEKREIIKSRLGKDISFLGKSEVWLMISFHDNSPMYFSGTDKPAAIVSVDLLGSARTDAYNKLTASVTETIVEQLSIPADRIFVKYSEYKHWGYNGANL